MIEQAGEKATTILQFYATAIRGMAPVKSEYDKQKLREQAREKGLVRWTDRQRQKVGAVGFLTGLPGGFLAIPLELADITYLMAVAGRGCYGVGHIFNRQIDYERDIPMILAVWCGAAHVATAATASQVALHVANPIVIQLATPAAVNLAGLAATSLTSYLVGQTGVKLLEKIIPKFLAKLGAKLASKTVAKAVPIIGGFVSCGINWWICGGLMHAAEKYYSAEVIVLDSEPDAPASALPSAI